MAELQLTLAQYHDAIRASIDRATAFVKRNVKDCRMNTFNARLARVWGSNMDLQFVLNPCLGHSHVHHIEHAQGRGCDELPYAQGGKYCTITWCN